MDLTKITNKQLFILNLLYRFRFLSTNHIQKFFNHKNSHRCQSWLKSLYDNQYAGRIYSRSIENIHKPAVYFLGLKGREKLKKDPKINKRILNRVYGDYDRSPGFVSKNLFIANLYFRFLEKIKKLKSELFFYTSVDLEQFIYLKELSPSLYVSIEKEGRQTKRFFLEVIDEHTPMYVLKKVRIPQYIEYRDEEEWERNTKFPFPVVVLICPRDKVKTQLINSLKENEDDISFYCLTREEILSKGLDILLANY